MAFKKLRKKIKKGFDKLGARIKEGGESLARRNQKAVARRSGAAKNAQVSAFLKSDTVKEINAEFGSNVRNLSRDAAIAIATVGAGAAASAIKGAGAGVTAAKAAATAAKVGKLVKTGTQVLKVATVATGAIKAIGGGGAQPSDVLTPGAVTQPQEQKSGALPLLIGGGLLLLGLKR